MSASSREVISLNIGQAGIQIGGECWELYCLEHGIKPNGQPSSDDHIASTSSTFFAERDNNRFVPRALFIDLEDTNTNRLRRGFYRNLFNPDLVFNGKEDSADMFARGYRTAGKELIGISCDRMRRLAEECSSLQGFILNHATGGGTGSGFSALLLEALALEYGNKSKFAVTVTSSENIGNSIIEPYNAVLSVRSLIEYVDAAVMINNESLYSICSNKLQMKTASYGNINRIIAQAVSSLTASLRFHGALNADLQDIQTNLVPFPRLHFLSLSLAPIVPLADIFREAWSVNEITRDAMSSNLSGCNFRNGRYMACCLLYRGDVVPKDVNGAVACLRGTRNIRFVDYSPTGFKCSISSKRPAVFPGGDLACVERNVCAVTNTTAIGENFGRMDHKFDLMFSKRAFVHWFAREGMEECEFAEAREDMAALERDYEFAGSEEVGGGAGVGFDERESTIVDAMPPPPRVPVEAATSASQGSWVIEKKTQSTS